MDTSKLSSDILEFLGRPTTKAFLENAQKYISIIENAENDTLDEFAQKMLPTLVELYSAGLSLDLIKVKYSTDSKKFTAVSDKYFDNIHTTLDILFSDYSPTWVASDPMGEKDQNVSINFIDENFEQIYLELKDETAKMDKLATNKAVEDALWQMKKSFITRWGKTHCINAIQALHLIKFRGYSIYTTKELTPPIN